MAKKRGPKINERDIALAAYWRVSRPELSSQALATELNKNPTTLKKRIEEAVARGWIANDWIFRQPPSQMPEILAETTSDHALEKAITQHFGEKQLSRLTVLPPWPPKGVSGGEVTPDEIEETNRRMVAHRAAQITLERLPRMRNIGLSYGRTLRLLVDKLEHYSIGGEGLSAADSSDPESRPNEALSQEDPERTIYTIMGALSFPFADARHGDYLEYSASHLTNRLAKILGKNCKRYFLDTPVYVPLAFLEAYSGGKPRDGIDKAKALDIAANFVKQIPTYHDLFGDDQKDGAIQKLDTVISSVGDLETGFGTRKDMLAPFLRKEEMETLLKEAVGDIAGRYVAKDGGTGAPGTTIAEVNSRIFGLELQHLEDIVKEAEKPEKLEDKKPGVIVIAASRKKANVIFALLNRTPKVISELIISADLAEELLKLCGKRRR